MVMTEKRVCQIQEAASAVRSDRKEGLETSAVELGSGHEACAAEEGTQIKHK